MQEGESVRFPESLKLRVPPGFMAALALAAERRHTSMSEFVRQTMLDALGRQGVRLHDEKVEALGGGA
jgi:hypothetical protein